MYYDASSSDYIRTNSFGIPDTGILTVEAWMKSVVNGTVHQSIIGEATQSTTIGYIQIFRLATSNILSYKYANGVSSLNMSFSNFFQNLDNQ